MWPLLSRLLVKRERFDWPRPILAPQLTWKISPFNCKSLQRIKSFVSLTCEQNISIGVKFIKFTWSVRIQNNLQSGKSQLATFSKGLSKKKSWWMNLNRKSCLNTAAQNCTVTPHKRPILETLIIFMFFNCLCFYNFVGLLYSFQIHLLELKYLMRRPSRSFFEDFFENDPWDFPMFVVICISCICWLIIQISEDYAEFSEERGASERDREINIQLPNIEAQLWTVSTNSSETIFWQNKYFCQMPRDQAKEWERSPCFAATNPWSEFLMPWPSHVKRRKGINGQTEISLFGQAQCTLMILCLFKNI